MNPMLLQFIAKADDTSAIIAGIIFGALILLIVLSGRRSGGSQLQRTGKLQ
jgi:hypothetical protein